MNLNLYLNKENSSVKIIEIKSQAEWDLVYNAFDVDPYNLPKEERDRHHNPIGLKFPFLMICNMDFEIDGRQSIIYFPAGTYDLQETAYYIRRSDGKYFKESDEFRETMLFSRKYSEEELKHARETCSLLNAMEDIKDVAAVKDGQKPTGFTFSVINSITRKEV